MFDWKWMKEAYARLTVNWVPKGVREEVLEGKKYWAVPMVMLVEGVHGGSTGPLFYPQEELAKTPEVWNHKPVVVEHPVWEGRAVSACEPVILNSRKVGLVLNTKWEGGKLKAEAWLDVLKARQVDGRVVEWVEQGKVMEVSTGLFVDLEEKEGEWNGERYWAVAKNYRPDHLALLPGGVGACSVADGAGLLRNGTVTEVVLKGAGHAYSMQEARRWGEENRLGDCTIQPEGDQVRFVRRKVKGVPVRELALNSQVSVIVTQELSHEAIRDGIAKAWVPKGGTTPVWVLEVFEDYAVVQEGDRLWKVMYQVQEDGVKLTSEPVEVKREVAYIELASKVMKKEGDGEHPSSHYLVVEDPQKPGTWHLRVRDVQGRLDRRLMGAAWAALHEGFRGNKYQGPNPRAALQRLKQLYREEGMDLPSENQRNHMKEELIKQILEAGTGWSEEDQEALMALNEAQLKRIADSSRPPEPPPTPPVPQSVEEYIAAAPEGMREVLANGVSAYQRQKQEAVASICKNERNPFSKEELEKMTLDHLNRLIQLAAVPNYAGQGAVPQPTVKEEEPLGLPQLNFNS